MDQQRGDGGGSGGSSAVSGSGIIYRGQGYDGVHDRMLSFTIEDRPGVGGDGAGTGHKGMGIVRHSDDGENVDNPGTLVCCGRFPKPIPFIIGQEFCERFSYYGMRAILVLYFTNFFGFSDSRATVLYHTFIMISYLTSVFGAILADSSLGKFKTILYLSIVYCAGNAVMAVTAIPKVAGDPPNWAGAMVGLVLIAIGTGGIKPCVSAFGGDQFHASQQHLLQSFFAAFYFSINAGSTLSTIITPKLRADVHCYGQDECYSLAFGLPAVLMAVATVVFIIGSSYYRRNIPTRNVILDFIRVIKVSILHKFSRNKGDIQVPKSHWLDPARKHFGDEFVNEVRQVLSVFIVFIPAPLFWTLFDQQGSRWTLQAQQMQMFNMGPLGRFRPDQMQAANAILVLIFIPVFERLVYPFLRRLHIPHTPLQRMISGMLLCGLAFVISGLLQIRIDASRPDLTIPTDMIQLRVTNVAGMSAKVTIMDTTVPQHSIYASWNTKVATIAFNNSLTDGSATRYFDISPEGMTIFFITDGLNPFVISNLTLSPNNRYSVHIYSDSNNGTFGFLVTDDKALRKNIDSNDEDPDAIDVKEDDVRIKFINLTPIELRITKPKKTRKAIISSLLQLTSTHYNEAVFPSGSVSLLFQEGDNGTAIRNFTTLNTKIEDGADYSFVLRWDGTKPYATRLIDVKGNSVSILLQLPQYVVVSCGEILFSITGLEFAFSEAPVSMKAVVQAGWLITVTIGSLIVIVVAESSFFNQRDEFFFFAGMMGVVCLLFIYIATTYKYLNPIYRDKSRKSTEKNTGDTTPLILSTEDNTSFA